MSRPNELPILDTDRQPFPGAVKMWDEAKGAVMWEARPGTREYADGYWEFYDKADEARWLRRLADQQRTGIAEALAKANDDIWFARDALREARLLSGARAFDLLAQAAQFRKFARQCRWRVKQMREQVRHNLASAAAIEASLRPMAAE